MNKTIKPMTRKEYNALPAVVRRFVKWTHAKRPQVIVLPEPQKVENAVKYFTQR